VSRLDGELEPKAAAGRRIEVITGGGGRRRWSEDEKARAIEASLAPGVVVSEVARLHGISPQQLFAWRREARRRFEASADAPPFVPAVVEAADGERASLQGAPSERATSRPHSIELDIDGTSVWIWRDANAAMVTAIIGALKAAK
jgi:transposase